MKNLIIKFGTVFAVKFIYGLNLANWLKLVLNIIIFI